jgi:hypothetical protein
VERLACGARKPSDRLVALLASGDRDLEHGEVAELAALLDRRLPPTIP